MLASISHGADSVYEIQPGTLLHLLANSVVLSHTTPHLPPSALLSLAATGRAYRALLYGTPSVFRRLDLSTIRLASLQIASVDRGGESWRRAQLGESWRNAQLDENLTEDEFYSGPLRGVFSALGRSGWLAGIHTLILDRVAVTAELVHEIITSPAYNVRILSLRDARHLNEHLLRRALRLVCRPSRPDGSPRLRGLYIFGSTGEENEGAAALASAKALASASLDAGDLWYRRRGRVLANSTSSRAVEWANTLMDCHGVLAFDAVLCNGPRHINSPAYNQVAVASGSAASSGNGNSNVPRHTPFALASHALGGCAGCGSAPEGWTVWGGESERADAAGYLSRYPLLWPPPWHSSNVRVAMCPEGERVNPLRHGRGVEGEDRGRGREHGDGNGDGNGENHQKRPTGPARFIARCDACIHDRMCFTCNRWWCESCMPSQVSSVASALSDQPSFKAPTIAYSCRECGPSCHECIAETQLRCRRCRSGYCTVHNVGSSQTHCDWCCAPSYRYAQQPRVSLKSHY